MPTIVQDYGPIYGEVVNGTVQGRPNGSVYVPLYNSVTLSLATSDDKLRTDGTSYFILGRVKLVAESQDLTSLIRTSLYLDASLATQIGSYRNFTAGQFNIYPQAIASVVAGDPALVAGNKYYIRAELVNNGAVVAASSTLEVEAI